MAAFQLARYIGAHAQGFAPPRRIPEEAHSESRFTTEAQRGIAATKRHFVSHRAHRDHGEGFV